MFQKIKLEDSKFDVKEFKNIISFLNVNGFVVIKNFYKKDFLINIKDIFLKIFTQEYKIKGKIWGHPTNFDGLQMLTYQKDIELVSDIKFKELFQNDFLKKISKSYFGLNDIEFNEKLRFLSLKHSKRPVTSWHYDATQSLKFWVNLQDTDEKNGALLVAPGTHYLGRLIAENNLLKGISIKKMRTGVRNDSIVLQNRISLNVSFGDLIIFDTDIFHTGGLISENQERLSIYSYTFPLPHKKNVPFCSPGWFLKSYFNINKINSLRKYCKRIICDDKYL